MQKLLKGIVLDRATLGSVDFPDALLNLCDWEIRETTTADVVKPVIQSYDIVLTNKVELTQEVLTGSAVKYIGVLATGTNIIDLEYCLNNNIEVKNAVGYSTDSVAQHTFTMLLSFLGSTRQNDDYVKSRYGGSHIFTHFGYEYKEIKGKTWGIIGLGNIGRKVAAIASVFGAEVVYYSSSDKDRSSTYKRVTLEELFSISDVLSIHSPLNEKTAGLVNLSRLSQMKKNAILLNLGRGGIVLENDLIEALNKNHLAGACLDVFEEEPFNFDKKYSKLNDTSKLLLSPHVAWASLEARQKLLDITCNNLISWKNKQVS